MVHKFHLQPLVILSLSILGHALDNGLALLPPMGWQAWVRFRCSIDCDLDPHNCLSESLIRTMADLVVEKGFKDVGYEYINIDDCWMATKRDGDGRLFADPRRFPNGMKNLADYVHRKGLKIGIYESMGYQTCQGFPGTFGHIEQDAQTFADWGIDFVKMDTCHTPSAELVSQGFKNFSRALNKTGQPIVFSCEWPHVISHPDWGMMFNYCNTIRNYIDVQDSWDTVIKIVNYFAANQEVFKNISGPGAYNDPDQLVVGDHALSSTQARSQMALWSVMAAQMLMSNDLRSLPTWAKDILKNKEVIAVNQDPLGIMGQKINKEHTVQVWTKPLCNGSFATVIFCGASHPCGDYSTTPAQLGYRPVSAYSVRDLFQHKSLGSFAMTDKLTFWLSPWESVMLQASPVSGSKLQDSRLPDL